ncbi:zf-HC2 domain-containing protein [bacterium]|nr:zf-HC2 domain-containing protein [bacterium]
MKCWIYKKKLFLYRQGELTAGEKRSLEKHLSSCERCREEAVRIRAVEQGAALLRAEKPDLSQPDELTDEVMRRIRTETAYRRMEGRADLFSGFFGRIPRFVYAVLAAAIIGSFFYQEYRILHKISGLERRMAGISGAGGGVPAGPVLDRLSAGLRTAGPVPGAGLQMPGRNESDDWILIRRRELDSLIRAYGINRSTAVPDMEKIRRILIRLYQSGYRVPDPAAETDWIIRHRRELMQKIDRLS